MMGHNFFPRCPRPQDEPNQAEVPGFPECKVSEKRRRHVHQHRQLQVGRNFTPLVPIDLYTSDEDSRCSYFSACQLRMIKHLATTAHCKQDHSEVSISGRAPPKATTSSK